MNAGEQLDQRRLAGAVLADDCVNLALFEGQIDGVEGVRGAEPLVELPQERSGTPSGRTAVSIEPMIELIP